MFSKRVTADELGAAAHADLVVWYILEIAASHILLPVLAIHYLRLRPVHNRTAVVNLCCTWIVTGIVSSLLLYAGTPTDGEPPQGLCIAQTALLGGAAPMTSLALLLLVHDVWCSTHATVRDEQQPQQSTKRMAMITAPYFAFLLYTACGVQLGTNHPDKVNRAQTYFYCSLNGYGYAKAVRIFSVAASVLSAIFQGLNLSILRHRHNKSSAHDQDSGTAIGFSTRVMLFCIYSLVSAIANLAALELPKGPFPDMFSASVGIALFLALGSDIRVLRSCGFLPPHPAAAPPTPPTPPKRRLSLPPTSASFDLGLLKVHNDSALSEQAQLAALQQYYAERVRGLGVDVLIIAKPQDAFLARRDSGAVMHDDEESTLPERPTPGWRF